MICPHCHVAFKVEPFRTNIAHPDHLPVGEWWGVESVKCPSCNEFTFTLLHRYSEEDEFGAWRDKWDESQVWPMGGPMPPAPPEVPKSFAVDYNEANAVFNLSPKASAALSRRCLQNIIHNHFGIEDHNLVKEIDQVINQRLVNSDLAGHLHGIRQIGNFAAHPQKSESSGEIWDVEPHEAEYMLEILRQLFDSTFVAKARMDAVKAKFNIKLADMGKPPLT